MRDERQPDSKPDGDAKAKAEPVPVPGQSWRDATERIRTTCDWITATMGAIAVAAVGSGTFLGFDRVDTWLRAGWVTWGLSLTVVGALLVLWRASLVKLPVSGSVSALLNPPTKEFEHIARVVNRDRTKQRIPSLQLMVDRRKTYDTERKTLAARVAELAADKTAAAKSEREAAEARIGYLDAELREIEANLTRTLHRAMYLAHRARFVNALPWLFAGALMAAAGFPTYFAAARLETTAEAAETDDAPETVAIPVPAKATFADRVSAVHPTCLKGGVQVLVTGGNGSVASPWQLRVLPTASCPSAFDLSLTSTDVTVVADAADPALTKLLAPPAASSSPSWHEDLSASERASLLTWLVTLLGYAGLGRAVSTERDPELAR